MKEIQLTRGLVAIVDDEDYGRLASYAWRAIADRRGAFYARGRVDGRDSMMHRLILDVKGVALVDHVNGDTLDNRRGNLRACTPRQNMQNSILNIRSRSPFKGIKYVRGDRQHSHHGPLKKPWRAKIVIASRDRSLGFFATAEAAALAYDAAARETFGEFCCVNFPRPGERSAITGLISS